MLRVIRDRLEVHPLEDIHHMQSQNPHIVLPSFCSSTLREAYQNHGPEVSRGRGTRLDGNRVDRQTYKTLNQVAQVLHYRNNRLMAEHAIASMFDGITGVYVRKYVLLHPNSTASVYLPAT